jgi:hypothetical protein
MKKPEAKNLVRDTVSLTEGVWQYSMIKTGDRGKMFTTRDSAAS